MDEKPRIPTKDDIHALPRWAKVAFLGRCVERMLPIIKKDWPDLPKAAHFLIASAGGISSVSAEAAHEASATNEIDQTAAFLKQAEDLDHRAAAHAIAVCGYAAAIPMIADMLKSTDFVFAALESVNYAYQGIGLSESLAIDSVWPDFVTICNAAKAENWTNDTAVPPEAFGTLWPNGTPKGWPDAHIKNLQGVKLTFDKKSLKGFTDGELKCLYVFPHILNRLKLLDVQVFSHWAVGTDTSLPDPVRQAALCGVVESIFLTAGELKEAWEAIQKCFYKSQVSQVMQSQLPSDIQAKLKRLPDYFSGTSLTTFLRNNFSYHNSPDTILESVKLLAEDDPHTVYLFPQENNYFDYATKLRLLSVAEHLKLMDCNTVIHEMLKVVVKEVLLDVSNVLNAILSTLFHKFTHQKEGVTLSDVKSEARLSADFYFYVDP